MLCYRDGLLLESQELALAGATMESLTAGVRKLKEMWTAPTKRCIVADVNRAEQGIPLEEMDDSGLRSRLASGQASGQVSGSANDTPDSPSTTSGSSGTITTGSDDNSETQGMKTVREV